MTPKKIQVYIRVSDDEENLYASELDLQQGTDKNARLEEIKKHFWEAVAQYNTYEEKGQLD